MAALGRVTNGGTSMSALSAAGVRHASRHPPRISPAEYARVSRLEGAGASELNRIRHFLHVPWPPQVESIAIPFQLAASNSVTPRGTRTGLPLNRKSTRCG